MLSDVVLIVSFLIIRCCVSDLKVGLFDTLGCIQQNLQMAPFMDQLSQFPH